MIKKTVAALVVSLCPAIACANNALSIADLYEDAILYAPTLNAAKYRYEMEKSRSKQSLGQWLPQVSISGSKNKNKSEENGRINEYDGNKVSLVARQKVFDWDAWQSKDSAALIADSRGAEFNAMQGSVVVDLVGRYFAVLEAERNVSALKLEVEALEERFRQIEGLYEKKLVKITDLFEVRSRRDLAAAQLVDADKQLRLAQEYLYEVVGYRVQSLVDLKEGVEFPEIEDDIDSWVKGALSDNANVKSVQYRLQAAEKDLSARKGFLLPKVDLIYSRQRTNLGYENSFLNNDRETSYVGLEVSMPIFSGGVNYHRNQESYYNREMTREELRQAQTEAEREVRDAYWGAKLSRAKIDATRQALDSYKKTFELMEKSYQYRTVTIADVLDAQKEMYKAQRDYETARYDFVRHFVMLKMQSGQLVEDDISTIEAWLR